jgi:translocation and assembly module TamA
MFLKPELIEITKAPVDINQLMQEIQTDSKIVVEANETGEHYLSFKHKVNQTEKVGFFRKIWNRFTQKIFWVRTKFLVLLLMYLVRHLRWLQISKAKLSSFTQESFDDFNGALPQLRVLTNQAAQAVGYYNAEFKFEKVSEIKLKSMLHQMNL